MGSGIASSLGLHIRASLVQFICR